MLAREYPDYAAVPITIVDFDDERMAVAAWSENAARKELTVMEEARAIVRMQERFGWTQEQIAAKLGIARSTVANKARLLALPDWIVTMVEEGKVSERQALACLPVYSIPSPILETAKRQDIYHFRRLDELLRSGASAEAIREHAAAMVALIYQFDLGDSIFYSEDGARCRSCPRRLAQRCSDKDCYDIQTSNFADAVLAACASRLSAETRREWRYVRYIERRTYTSFATGEFCVACPDAWLAWRGTPNAPGPEWERRVVFACMTFTGCKRTAVSRQESAVDEDEVAREKARRTALRRVKAAAQAQMVERLRSGAAWRAVLKTLDPSLDVPRDEKTTVDMVAARILGRVCGRTSDPAALEAAVEKFMSVYA